MEVGHAGSPFCSLHTHSPIIFSACCNTAMQIWSADIFSVSLHGPAGVTWHFQMKLSESVSLSEEPQLRHMTEYD